ncbi:hypothetical protein [Diaminobutyricimonas sp. LJ205]|uniref:hypothetical protein n=1 Tax=Diaminobutyricimonas sp. LJ205 TaxID=2683590 RepID=UPI0012F528EB|nr:hypothetical protein [Diaminobutyricimonas sp. LJ205]
MTLVTLDNGLKLEQHTAATWLAFRAAVLEETGVTLRITWPNGAHRTPTVQQALRDRWERGEGAYAALPGESNHEDGTAWDIANYKAVPDATLQRIGRRFGLKRDPYEAWHYNDTGSWIAPAAATITPIEEEEPDMARPIIITGQQTGEKFPYVVDPYTGERSFLNEHQLSLLRTAGSAEMQVTMSQEGFDAIPKRRGSVDHDGSIVG